MEKLNTPRPLFDSLRQWLDNYYDATLNQVIKHVISSSNPTKIIKKLELDEFIRNDDNGIQAAPTSLWVVEIDPGVKRLIWDAVSQQEVRHEITQGSRQGSYRLKIITDYGKYFKDHRYEKDANCDTSSLIEIIDKTTGLLRCDPASRTADFDIRFNANDIKDLSRKSIKASGQNLYNLNGFWVIFEVLKACPELIETIRDRIQKREQLNDKNETYDLEASEYVYRLLNGDLLVDDDIKIITKLFTENNDSKQPDFSKMMQTVIQASGLSYFPFEPFTSLMSFNDKTRSMPTCSKPKKTRIIIDPEVDSETSNKIHIPFQKTANPKAFTDALFSVHTNNMIGYPHVEILKWVTLPRYLLIDIARWKTDASHRTYFNKSRFDKIPVDLHFKHYDKKNDMSYLLLDDSYDRLRISDYHIQCLVTLDKDMNFFVYKRSGDSLLSEKYRKVSHPYNDYFQSMGSVLELSSKICTSLFSDFDVLSLKFLQEKSDMCRMTFFNRDPASFKHDFTTTRKDLDGVSDAHKAFQMQLPHIILGGIKSGIDVAKKIVDKMLHANILDTSYQGAPAFLAKIIQDIESSTQIDIAIFAKYRNDTISLLTNIDDGFAGHYQKIRLQNDINAWIIFVQKVRQAYSGRRQLANELNVIQKDIESIRLSSNASGVNRIAPCLFQLKKLKDTFIDRLRQTWYDANLSFFELQSRALEEEIAQHLLGSHECNTIYGETGNDFNDAMKVLNDIAYGDDFGAERMMRPLENLSEAYRKTENARFPSNADRKNRVDGLMDRLRHDVYTYHQEIEFSTELFAYVYFARYIHRFQKMHEILSDITEEFEDNNEWHITNDLKDVGNNIKSLQQQLENFIQQHSNEYDLGSLSAGNSDLWHTAEQYAEKIDGLLRVVQSKIQHLPEKTASESSADWMKDFSSKFADTLDQLSNSGLPEAGINDIHTDLRACLQTLTNLNNVICLFQCVNAAQQMCQTSATLQIEKFHPVMFGISSLTAISMLQALIILLMHSFFYKTTTNQLSSDVRLAIIDGLQTIKSTFTYSSVAEKDQIVMHVHQAIQVLANVHEDDQFDCRADIYLYRKIANIYDLLQRIPLSEMNILDKQISLDDVKLQLDNLKKNAISACDDLKTSLSDPDKRNTLEKSLNQVALANALYRKMVQVINVKDGLSKEYSRLLQEMKKAAEKIADYLENASLNNNSVADLLTFGQEAALCASEVNKTLQSLVEKSLLLDLYDAFLSDLSNIQNLEKTVPSIARLKVIKDLSKKGNFADTPSKQIIDDMTSDPEAERFGSTTISKALELNSKHELFRKAMFAHMDVLEFQNLVVKMISAASFNQTWVIKNKTLLDWTEITYSRTINDVILKKTDWTQIQQRLGEDQYDNPAHLVSVLYRASPMNAVYPETQDIEYTDSNLKRSQLKQFPQTSTSASFSASVTPFPSPTAPASFTRI